jgi:hypothetical protein
MKVSRGKSIDRYYILPRVFIHRIHDSDPAGTYHSHPWNGVSFIFGGYWEDLLDGTRHRRSFINFIRATRHHRVFIERPVWTLFIHAKKKKNHKWSIKTYAGNQTTREVFEPWRGEPGLKNYEAEAMP